MKAWIKLGLWGGGIGIILHILVNFLPLLFSYYSAQPNQNLLVLTNMSLSYNISRIIIYFIAGFIIGGIIGLIIEKIKKK